MFYQMWRTCPREAPAGRFGPSSSLVPTPQMSLFGRPIFGTWHCPSSFQSTNKWTERTFFCGCGKNAHIENEVLCLGIVMFFRRPCLFFRILLSSGRLSSTNLVHWMSWKNSTLPVFKELHFSGKYSSITRLDALHCVLAYYYFCFYTFILDRYTEKILIFQQIFSLAQDIKLKNFYLYSI